MKPLCFPHEGLRSSDPVKCSFTWWDPSSAPSIVSCLQSHVALRLNLKTCFYLCFTASPPSPTPFSSNLHTDLMMSFRRRVPRLQEVLAQNNVLNKQVQQSWVSWGEVSFHWTEMKNRTICISHGAVFSDIAADWGPVTADLRPQQSHSSHTHLLFPFTAVVFVLRRFWEKCENSRHVQVVLLRDARSPVLPGHVLQVPSEGPGARRLYTDSGDKTLVWLLEVGCDASAHMRRCI